MYSFEDYVEFTQNAKSLAEVEGRFKKVLADEGYDNFVWSRLSYQKIDQLLFWDFPGNFIETYLANDWSALDPVLDRLLSANQPFYWNQVNRRDRTTAKQWAMIEACREEGVHSGIAFPFRGATGRHETFSISKRHGHDTDPARLPVIQAFCAQTWARGSDFCPIPEPDAKIPPLSRRELECLQWMKAGKTNGDIAEIMSITEKTVEFHVTNILNKLSAPNRISAVVIALQRGIIHL